MPSEPTFYLPMIYNIYCILLSDIRGLDNKKYLICHIYEIYWHQLQTFKGQIFCKTQDSLLINALHFQLECCSCLWTLSCRDIGLEEDNGMTGVFEHNRWHSYLDVEAQTKRVMVAVVGRIPSEVEAGQLRLRIPGIGMVDPATPHMSWRLRKLMEAQIDEHSG